jgi:RHS repeat-associated protein
LGEDCRQAGFLRLSLVNDSDNTVYFDDFEITHRSGDEKLSVTSWTDYYPYGKVAKTSCPSNGAYRYGYQGEFAEKDGETDWNSFELRQYDSEIGRFTTTDPMGEFWSSYVGMGNDPVNLTDPTGGVTDDFHYDKDGNFMYKEEKSWLHDLFFGHRAVYHGEAGDIYIYLQDQFTDPKRIMGELKAGPGDMDDLPPITKLEFVTPERLKGILQGKEGNSNIYEHIRQGLKWLIGSNDKSLDYGYNTFKNDVLYVVKLNDNYYQYFGFNAQNMGNFTLGMVFHEFNFTALNGAALGHAYAWQKYKMPDSMDDQQAIIMGWNFARTHFGENAGRLYRGESKYNQGIER